MPVEGRFVLDLKAIKEPGYSFYLVNIECLPFSANFNVIMELDESIEELLPYLAARLPGCTYIHGSGVINYMDSGHIIAVHPLRTTFTDINGLEDATSLCRNFYKKIVEIRGQKDSITPVYDKRPGITVLDIVKALPRTNCGLCRSLTCMAFAAKVFRRESSIVECEPLKQNRSDYESLLQHLEIYGFK